MELRNATETAQRLLTDGRRSLLPVWAGVTIIEALLWMSLPMSAARWWSEPTFLDGIGTLADQPPISQLILTILGLWAVDFLRTGLYRPARDVVLKQQTLSPRDVILRAGSRVVPVLAIRQTIGFLVVFAALVCLMVGARLSLFPELVMAFTLAPAIYLVAARDLGVTDAIQKAMSWSRKHLLAVFGSQALLVCLWSFYWDAFQKTLVVAVTWPLVAGVGATFGFVAVRFAEWVVMTSTFLTLDHDESQTAAAETSDETDVKAAVEDEADDESPEEQTS